MSWFQMSAMTYLLPHNVATAIYTTHFTVTWNWCYLMLLRRMQVREHADLQMQIYRCHVKEHDNMYVRCGWQHVWADASPPRRAVYKWRSKGALHLSWALSITNRLYKNERLSAYSLSRSHLLWHDSEDTSAKYITYIRNRNRVRKVHFPKVSLSLYLSVVTRHLSGAGGLKHRIPNTWILLRNTAARSLWVSAKSPPLSICIHSKNKKTLTEYSSTAVLIV